MQENSFKKIFRTLLKQPWWDRPLVAHLFTHLLLSAVFGHVEKIIDGKLVVLKPGQYYTTLRRLKKETGITLQSIRTALELLKSTQQITQQIYTQGMVITITNWLKWEDSNTETNTRLTHDQHTTNTIIRKKEYKEYKTGSQELIELFKDHYYKHTNAPYIVSPKDKQAAKRIVTTIGKDHAIKLTAKYFSDPWWKERKCWTINKLEENLNNLTEKEKKPVFKLVEVKTNETI